VTCPNLHSKIIKIAIGLGTHVLEGEGDAFSQKKETKEHMRTEALQTKQRDF
jgi:hypothetical protein